MWAGPVPHQTPSLNRTSPPQGRPPSAFPYQACVLFICPCLILPFSTLSPFPSFSLVFPSLHDPVAPDRTESAVSLLTPLRIAELSPNSSPSAALKVYRFSALGFPLRATTMMCAHIRDTSKLVAIAASLSAEDMSSSHSRSAAST